MKKHFTLIELLICITILVFGRILLVASPSMPKSYQYSEKNTTTSIMVNDNENEEGDNSIEAEESDGDNSSKVEESGEDNSTVNAPKSGKTDYIRREVDGYGGGDSTIQAIEAAKRDAVINAAGIRINTIQTDGMNDNKDLMWGRGCGILWKYIITEKGEDFAGIYARVKADVSAMPLTRPLKEAEDLKFTVENSAISQIRTNAAKGVNGGANVVTVVGLGKNRNEALMQAWKNAVEAGAGRFYEIAQKMSGEEIDREQFMSIANGFVEAYTIEEEETSEKTGTVRIQMRAKVKCGGIAKNPLDGLSDVQRQTLAFRNDEICNFLKVELDNMKSIVPYLYKVVLVSQEKKSNDKAEIEYEIRINENVYNNIFIPRFLQILTVICEQTPVELHNIGTYNLVKNSVKVSWPDKDTGLDIFGVTVVDQASNGSFSHAFNFTLNPEVKRVIKEWRKQVFTKADIHFKVVSKSKDGKQLYASEDFSAKAKKLHNTPVPYFAKGWGIWYDDIWLPVVSDDNAVVRGKVKVNLPSTVKQGELSIEVKNQRPSLDMNAIMSARQGSDKPTMAELLLSIVVRIGLALLALINLIIIIICFAKTHNIWVGLLTLLIFGTIGGLSVVLIIL